MRLISSCRCCLRHLHARFMYELSALCPQALLAHFHDMLAFSTLHHYHCAANQVDSVRIRHPTRSQPKRFHRREYQQLELRFAKCTVSVRVALLLRWRVVLTGPEPFRYVIINWSADGILVGKGLLCLWAGHLTCARCSGSPAFSTEHYSGTYSPCSFTSPHLVGLPSALRHPWG